MKLLKGIFLITSSILFSCQENANKQDEPSVISNNKTEEQSFTDNTIVNSNASVILSIEGMTCEMGCGSVIRKNLYNSGGVSQCSFDFKNNRVSNSMEVFFDSTLTQENAIIEVINAIEEGDFKAKKNELK